MMTLDELRDLFENMHVTFDDDFTLTRAIIYYEFVAAVYEIFTQSDIGKNDLLSPALMQSNLLKGLCDILDEYIVPAVNVDLQAMEISYGDYFDEIFQDPNLINDFFGRHPKTSQALEILTASFQNNILTACDRILNDWDVLDNMFCMEVENYTLLSSLTHIQSTGSDFHKDGQQVLILTFDLLHYGTRRIIYKPSDLEVDCLIMGNSEAVNKVYKKSFGFEFQEESLMEIFNKLIKDNNKKKKMYGKNLQLLPTIKILPMKPGSRLTDHEIRESYGYIEFLGSTGRNPFDIYSGARRHSVITSYQDKDQICEKFYTLIGQLTAIAATFSISDLHLENLIVHEYKPYLIDLENSLTRPINHLADTEMFSDDKSAIYGVSSEERQFRPSDKDDYNNSTSIKTHWAVQYEKNRLWTDTNKSITSQEYGNQILSGFENTMMLMAKKKDVLLPFADWLKRLEGAIVRIVPLPTQKFQGTIEYAYLSDERAMEIDEAIMKIDEAIEVQMATHLSELNNDWVEDPTIPPPLFLCLQPQYVRADLASLNVPVFYHRLNTTDVIDSRGTPIDGKSYQLEQESIFLESPINNIEAQLCMLVNSDRIKRLLEELADHISSDWALL